MYFHITNILRHCHNTISKSSLLPTYGSLLKSSMSSVDISNILVEKRDRYNGVILHSTVELCSSIQFYHILVQSLQKWKREKVRTVWFNISLEHSTLIPILANNNFKFHHASNDGRIVTMYLWLPDDEPCMIPPYAHTMIGAGAIVINENDELLIVSERFNNKMWKLPGGFVEPGEDIDTAAEREVFEETGIKTKFQSVILLRHTHNSKFGCSDVYIISKLKPLSSEITKCDYEISDAMWIDIETYINHPHVHELNKSVMRTYLQYEKNGGGLVKEQGIHPVTKKPYSLYNMTF